MVAGPAADGYLGCPSHATVQLRCPRGARPEPATGRLWHRGPVCPSSPGNHFVRNAQLGVASSPRYITQAGRL